MPGSDYGEKTNDPKRAWEEFRRRLQRWRPKVNSSYEMDLPDTED